MGTYSYTSKTGILKKFFNGISSNGVPNKITVQYLTALGYKSSNDRRIIPILKSLKFIDDSGKPTEKYLTYRDKNKSQKILGASLKEAYKELFSMYPDAEKRDLTTLQNFFATHTGAGESAAKAMVDTFKALCSMSDLEAGEEKWIQSSENNNKEEPTGSREEESYHNISFALTEGKKAKIILPSDISKEDIEKIKKMLDALI